jgi:hypothetical protein
MSQTIQQPLFGQAIVKDAIEKLGGKATPEQLRNFLSEHYPQHSIVKTYNRALNGMIKKDEITKQFSGAKFSSDFVYVLKS